MDYSLESNQLFGSAFDDVSMGYMPDPGMVSCGMEMTPGVGGNCIATGSTSFVSISREVTDARLYDETEWYGGEPSDAAYARLQGAPGYHTYGAVRARGGRHHSSFVDGGIACRRIVCETKT